MRASGSQTGSKVERTISNLRASREVGMLAEAETIGAAYDSAVSGNCPAAGRDTQPRP